MSGGKASRNNSLPCWAFFVQCRFALFYAGLNWGQHTHLSIVEYWRWWSCSPVGGRILQVGHDGDRVYLHEAQSSPRGGRGPVLSSQPRSFFRAALSAPAITLTSRGQARRGPRLGVCIQCLGSGSAPVLVGFDAMEDLRRSRTSPWVQRYKWPIYFFTAVAFWNMVGAGLFGFMINPPIVLYYMQGLSPLARPCRACSACTECSVLD